MKIRHESRHCNEVSDFEDDDIKSPDNDDDKSDEEGILELKLLIRLLGFD